MKWFLMGCDFAVGAILSKSFVPYFEGLLPYFFHSYIPRFMETNSHTLSSFLSSKQKKAASRHHENLPFHKLH